MRDLRAAIRNLPAAEHDYDWAPMHMPGSVQDYGVLLVADSRSRRILFASDNAPARFGIAMTEILDRSYLSLSELESERTYVAERIKPETILFPNPVRLTIRGKPFDAVFHACGNTHQIEMEPVSDTGGKYDDMALRAAEDLYDPPTVQDLYQRAVRTIKSVSGFDRVMLYRFDSRNNGQVIAEATRDGIGSFLGLFFPSSDIGARARDLYLQNFTRYIPDIACATHGLSSVFSGNGKADSAHPVDMSFANLRSVVPCHIAYLQNIGIKASMSFSINVDGRLWGLFACHHYEPKLVSYEQRVVCEQTAMMFIYRLVSMSSSAARLARRQGQLTEIGNNILIGAQIRRRLVELEREWHGTAEADPVSTMLSKAVKAVEAETCHLLSAEPPRTEGDAEPTDAQKILLNLVEADSAAIIRHGRVARIGDAPAEMAVYAIASMFGRELPDIQHGDLNLYATDCLSVQVPVADAVKDRAAGILAVSLSADSPEYLIWFRKEQIVHATWAGNPSADAMSAGSEGLNPRASFEAWKQDIRDLSRPWVLEDVQIAEQLASIVRGLEQDGLTTVPAAPRSFDLPPVETVPTASGNVIRTAFSPANQSRRVIRIGQR